MAAQHTRAVQRMRRQFSKQLDYEILAVIATDIGYDDSPATTSYRGIAERVDCHYNTVSTHVDRLEANGWITIQNKGKRNQCYYLQNIDCDDSENIITTTVTNSDEIVTRVVMIEERLSQLEDGLSQCLSQLSQLIVTINQSKIVTEDIREVKREEKIPNANALGQTAEMKPYDVFVELKKLEPGMKKGQSLREIKELLAGDEFSPPYSPDDIIGCGEFLQTERYRRDEMIPLSTQGIKTKIAKWVQAGRPPDYDTWKASQPSSNGHGSHKPKKLADKAHEGIQW